MDADLKSRVRELPESQIDTRQRRYRKWWRRRTGAVVRFYEVLATGDVLFTVTDRGALHDHVLQATLADYYGVLLAASAPAGGTQ